jgi:hypothetical protein
MVSPIAPAGDAPVARACFRCVQWRGRAYWFRPHERPWIRCLFLASLLGSGIPAEELPRTMRADSDAWGELIVDEDGVARLAAVPLLSLPGRRRQRPDDE